MEAANSAEAKEYLCDNSFTSKFDDLVKQKLEKWHVPGLSIAVINNGNIASKVRLLTLWPSNAPN